MLEGTGWIIRDLARQTEVKGTEKEGRTEVVVDLITEPGVLLALVKAMPASVELKTRGVPKLGGELTFTADVPTGSQSMGPIPMKYEIIDPAGKVRDTIFRTAGDDVIFPLAARDTAGAWKLVGQELLTGMTATWEFKLAAAELSAASRQVGDVHVPEPEHIRHFFERPAVNYHGSFST